jgi:hypothetical protein
MARFIGGSKVESGYYVNTRSFAVVSMPVEGCLPGGPEDAFVSVPWPLLLMAAPVVGGVFVLAYPVVGFSMMVYGLARKAAGAAGDTAKDLAATMAPGHAVGEAHLTGKPGEGEPVEGSDMEDLEAEISKAREEKKP